MVQTRGNLNEQGALRSTYHSGEDWNNCGVNTLTYAAVEKRSASRGRARIGPLHGRMLGCLPYELRPVFGAGEDWNQNGVTVTLQKPMLRSASRGRARIGTCSRP